MTNRPIVIGTILSGIVIVGAVIAVACSGSPDTEVDLASTHTTAALATEEQPEESQAEALPAQTETEDSGNPSQGANAANITYGTATYTEGSISIRYPVISHMDDEGKQDQVNQLLKDNALSLLKAWNTDTQNCTIEVKCQVPSINRKRITAVYTGTVSQEGAAHPVNLFYTNTVDLNTVKDLGLSDFADPYTMAGYVLSDDVQFDGASGQQLAGILEERKGMDLAAYTEIFEKADFPFDASTAWPSSFSYEQQGEIYFSIPVSHALGDYAIVKFTPETK